jgi:hypothetical protein
MVKKHIRLLTTYKLRAEYTLLLTLIDPISGPCTSWPPLIYMATINVRKNRSSSRKYARFWDSFHQLPSLNNCFPPSPFRATAYKYSYPTSVRSRFLMYVIKLYLDRRNSELYTILSMILLKSMAGTWLSNVNDCINACNRLAKRWYIVSIRPKWTGSPL